MKNCLGQHWPISADFHCRLGLGHFHHSGNNNRFKTRVHMSTTPDCRRKSWRQLLVADFVTVTFSGLRGQHCFQHRMMGVLSSPSQNVFSTWINTRNIRQFREAISSSRVWSRRRLTTAVIQTRYIQHTHGVLCVLCIIVCVTHCVSCFDQSRTTTTKYGRNYILLCNYIFLATTWRLLQWTPLAIVFSTRFTHITYIYT